MNWFKLDKILTFNHIVYTYFYMQVGINISGLSDIKDDLDFTEKLVAEESVFCLPGKVG